MKTRYPTLKELSLRRLIWLIYCSGEETHSSIYNGTFNIFVSLITVTIEISFSPQKHLYPSDTITKNDGSGLITRLPIQQKSLNLMIPLEMRWVVTRAKLWKPPAVRGRMTTTLKMKRMRMKRMKRVNSIERIRITSKEYLVWSGQTIRPSIDGSGNITNARTGAD
jgi:hypothetical protein